MPFLECPTRRESGVCRVDLLTMAVERESESMTIAIAIANSTYLVAPLLGCVLKFLSSQHYSTLGDTPVEVAEFLKCRVKKLGIIQEGLQSLLLQFQRMKECGLKNGCRFTESLDAKPKNIQQDCCWEALLHSELHEDSFEIKFAFSDHFLDNRVCRTSPFHSAETSSSGHRDGEGIRDIMKIDTHFSHRFQDLLLFQIQPLDWR